MKEVLMVLMRSYKWHITISSAFLVIVLLGIHAINGFVDLEYLFAALVCYTFFVATLWNAWFVYMPSVDENSNGAAVFSRWVLILVSLFTLLYVLLEPLYVN